MSARRSEVVPPRQGTHRTAISSVRHRARPRKAPASSVASGRRMRIRRTRVFRFVRRQTLRVSAGYVRLGQEHGVGVSSPTSYIKLDGGLTSRSEMGCEATPVY